MTTISEKQFLEACDLSSGNSSLEVVDRYLNQNKHVKIPYGALRYACWLPGWMPERKEFQKTDPSILMRLLDDPRANPWEQEEFGQGSWFQYAVLIDNVELIEKLLSDPRCDPNESYFGDLAFTGKTEVSHRLINSPRISPEVKLSGAAYSGNLELVNQLILENVDPNTDQSRPVRCAVINGHHDVVERLLQDPRVDPSTYHNEAISNAIGVHYHNEENQLKIVNLLLNHPRVTPRSIYGAVRFGNGALLKRLLEDPRLRNSVTDEIIRVATERGHPEILEILRAQLA